MRVARERRRSTAPSHVGRAGKSVDGSTPVDCTTAKRFAMKVIVENVHWGYPELARVAKLARLRRARKILEPVGTPARSTWNVSSIVAANVVTWENVDSAWSWFVKLAVVVP